MYTALAKATLTSCQDEPVARDGTRARGPRDSASAPKRIESLGSSREESNAYPTLEMVSGGGIGTQSTAVHHMHHRRLRTIILWVPQAYCVSTDRHLPLMLHFSGYLLTN